MNPTRRFLALLPLATLLAVAGCQKYAAAEVRRGIDLPVAVVVAACAQDSPSSQALATAGLSKTRVSQPISSSSAVARYVSIGCRTESRQATQVPPAIDGHGSSVPFVPLRSVP